MSKKPSPPPPRLSQARLMRIYRALVDGADLDRCQAIMAGLDGLSVADCIILAGQIVGNAIAALPGAQRTDMLQGLFVAINDIVDQRQQMAGSRPPQ